MADFHWADRAAEEVINRGDKKVYTIAAGITPSGTIHIGNFREIITVDLVRRALEKRGKKARFVYSWDNFDVFRKVPADAPKKELLEKYLRFPITKVPDTYDGKHESYAEHNQKEVEETIPMVGINPEFLYQADKYGKCEYAEEIKKVLDKKDEIKKILDKYRTEERGDNWWPVSIFCAKCNKDTTRVLNWDGKYELEYECDCGFKEKFDFRKKGIAKLPWRIDWPMRWNYEKVDFEPGGKEHSTPGGSRTTAVEIFNLLYKNNPPIYLKYDFITIKGIGGKISKSKGNLISLQDTLEVYEPNVLRYLFTSTRPDTEFAISFDLDVLKIYEDFDRCERNYFNKEGGEKERRIYELSVLKVPKKLQKQHSFRHLTTILQIFEGDIKKSMEYLGDKKIIARMKCVKNWIDNYAPEEMKFKLNEKVKLEENEKEIFEIVLDRMKDKTDKELHDEFYNICKERSIEPNEFFKMFYRVLINKERGPRLASFLLSIGVKRLRGIFGLE